MTSDIGESGRSRKELVVALVGGMASFTFCHDLIISATDLPCLLVFAVVVAPAVGLLDAMTAPSRLTEVGSRRLFKVIVIITTVIKICAAALVIAFASSAVCIIVYSLLHVMRDESLSVASACPNLVATRRSLSEATVHLKGVAARPPLLMRSPLAYQLGEL